MATITGSANQTARIARRALSDGGLVVNHSLVFSDGAPVAVRFDLWRVAEGRVVEH
jgi:predicted SnoaL-like aldol condensation-catalyzing enzyme